MEKAMKVNKEQLIVRVAEELRDHKSMRDLSERARINLVHQVLDTTIDAIISDVKEGKRVSLTGFGSFYSQIHRGHPVQFGTKTERVPDYPVFKFAVSNVLNKDFRG